MGSNGPHSWRRNSSFALAMLRPDGFVGASSTGAANGTSTVQTVQTVPLLVTGRTLIVTADVRRGTVTASSGGGGGGSTTFGSGGVAAGAGPVRVGVAGDVGARLGLRVRGKDRKRMVRINPGARG